MVFVVTFCVISLIQELQILLGTLLSCTPRVVQTSPHDRDSIQAIFSFVGSKYCAGRQLKFLSTPAPNMLITGRSGNLAPVQQVYVDDDGLSEALLSFIEELERAWWCQYKGQYFTSLVPTQK